MMEEEGIKIFTMKVTKVTTKEKKAVFRQEEKDYTNVTNRANITNVHKKAFVVFGPFVPFVIMMLCLGKYFTQAEKTRKKGHLALPRER
jgi:hypothetical protein